MFAAGQRLVDKERALSATLAAHGHSTQRNFFWQFANAQTMQAGATDYSRSWPAASNDGRIRYRTVTLPNSTEFQRREEQMTTELGRQVTVLKMACQHLLLRPDDLLIRESLARTIATTEPSPEDSAFVRGLVDEVRTHAESLAFRLESAGYDCLHISARTALLCQALAELKMQLQASAGQATAGRPN